MNEFILIVEDEEDVAELLRYNLRKTGYRTMIAGDGARALRLVQYGMPDLILLDIMLPEMDGWEVCRILRESEQAALVPVIMLSALSTEEARIRGLLLGADDYLNKPFSMQELLLKVRRALDQRKAARTLERTVDAQGASAQYLVHELKNSLNLIAGYSELAALRNDRSPFMDQVVRTAHHMSQVLDNMNVIAQFEQGTLRVPQGPVEILPLLLEVRDWFSRQIEEAGLHLAMVDRTPATVFGNATAIRQILLNLVSNAVKYNRPGGGILISCDASDQWVALSVKDEGPGIPPDEQAKVFEKFYRSPDRTAAPGSGLGLFIVKVLTEAMGGTVALASDAESGTTVTAALKRTPVPAATGTL
jgi:signal transduction histidine kinase